MRIRYLYALREKELRDMQLLQYLDTSTVLTDDMKRLAATQQLIGDKTNNFTTPFPLLPTRETFDFFKQNFKVTNKKYFKELEKTFTVDPVNLDQFTSHPYLFPVIKSEEDYFKILEAYEGKVVVVLSLDKDFTERDVQKSLEIENHIEELFDDRVQVLRVHRLRDPLNSWTNERNISKLFRELYREKSLDHTYIADRGVKSLRPSSASSIGDDSYAYITDQKGLILPIGRPFFGQFPSNYGGPPSDDVELEPEIVEETDSPYRAQSYIPEKTGFFEILNEVVEGEFDCAFNRPDPFRYYNGSFKAENINDSLILLQDLDPSLKVVPGRESWKFTESSRLVVKLAGQPDETHVISYEPSNHQLNLVGPDNNITSYQLLHVGPYHIVLKKLGI